MNRFKYSVLISVVVAMSAKLVLVLVSHVLPMLHCNCIMPSPDAKDHLSSKTPYRFVANVNDSALLFTGCSSSKIVGVIRHGTRTPSYKYINGMRGRLATLVKELHPDPGEDGLLCPEQQDQLSAWHPDTEIANDDEKLLTSEGEAELLAMGTRMLHRFPSLLSHPYSNDSYFFKYTASQRTHLSAESFASGLFGKEVAHKVWYPEAVPNDPILRFYKGCNRWQKDVKKNREAVKERIEMIESQEVVDLLKRLPKRLGYNGTFSFDDVYLMYMTCSFETAWHRDRTSPWCSVFTLEEFQTMEYVEDLKFYYIDGYGHSLNHQQACPLVEDIFQRLLGGKEHGVFYFTHSGTVLKLLSHLGLYKDDKPLESEAKPEDRLHRQWRTSKIDPFASNIFFILHKCSDGDKLAVMHQERLVTLPWCGEELCPLEKVVAHLHSSIHGCNFSDMCSLKSG